MKSSQDYSELPIKISCASLNFKKLDKNSLKILQSASFSDPQTVFELFKKKLGFEVEQLSVIQKCNAVMVVIVLNQNISTDYLRNCIFEVWDKLSTEGIVDNLNQFVFYEDELAVKYIAECALGLNSITIGDSQVFSQINNEIQASGQK
jgi:glutamyl-tRNA reductase